MKKKTKNVLILVILTVFCLGIFASCVPNRPDLFNYSDSDLGVMGKLVRWMHSWVGNYGWTVVVFTVFLKILMTPLDIWQRYASRKSSLKMQQMQPIMDSIDKRYGANTQRANEEKQKLYKKQGFSMLSTCLPMIVSMVIFFVMFAGLRDYSSYSSVVNFQGLSSTYFDTYVEQIVGENADEEIREVYFNGTSYKDDNGDEKHIKGFNETEAELGDGLTSEEGKGKLICQTAGLSAVTNAFPTESLEAEQKALEAVREYYEHNHESWLWIENVWQPDTWATIMQPYEGGQFEGGGFSSTVDMSKFPGGNGEELYNKLRNEVMKGNGYSKNGKWNGLMILPFASIGLSFLSMFISQRMERKNRKGEVVEQNQQQKVTNRTMMILMPLMMAWFGFIYTGAFAIYMVVNYTLSIISTVLLRYPVEKMVNKRLNKEDNKNKSNKASYMR